MAASCEKDDEIYAFIKGGDEFYSLYNESNIMEDIKIRRLGWAGNIIRMEEERVPKKVLNGNVYTTRPVGRPRTGWAGVVQRDALQLLGMRGWRRRAEIKWQSKLKRNFANLIMASE